MAYICPPCLALSVPLNFWKLGPVCIRGCLLLEHEARMRRDGPGLLINEVPAKPGFGERLPILPSQVACKAVPDAMLRRTRCDVAAGNPQRANGLKRQSRFLDGLRLAFVDWNFSTQEVNAEVEDRQSGLPPRNSCKHGLASFGEPRTESRSTIELS